MLVPLAIINHFKPTRALPGEKQLHELYPLGTEQRICVCHAKRDFWTWRNFFLRVDDALEISAAASDSSIAPARAGGSGALDARTHRRGSDGLAAVFPAMLNA